MKEIARGPDACRAMLNGPDEERKDRAMNAVLKMTKIDIAELQRAAAGESASA